jgi:hypothetical protein
MTDIFFDNDLLAAIGLMSVGSAHYVRMYTQHGIQTGFGAHSASYSMFIGASFPELKATGT